MDNIYTVKIVFSNFGKYFLAIVLLISGISKCFYLHSFSIEVSLYSELYVSSLFVPFSGQIAIVVCCVEILLGFLLFFERYSLYSTFIVFILLLCFLYLTGINYLFPTLLGSIESCGCFGELIHFSAKGSFIKTIVLWLISFRTFTSNIRKNRPKIGR